MILFLKVFFWVAVIDIASRLINLSFAPYPREVKRWHDAFNLAVNAVFTVWAWYLVWGV